MNAIVGAWLVLAGVRAKYGLAQTGAGDQKASPRQPTTDVFDEPSVIRCTSRR